MVVALGATGGCVVRDIIVLVFLFDIIDHAHVILAFDRRGRAFIVDRGSDALVVVSLRLQGFWETAVWTSEFQIRRLL